MGRSVGRVWEDLLGEYGKVCWEIKTESGVSMEYHLDAEWDKADLFFLSNTLRHGMPVDRVAGFLSRSEWEVGAKARELKVSIAEDDVVPAQRKTP